MRGYTKGTVPGRGGGVVPGVSFHGGNSRLVKGPTLL